MRRYPKRIPAMAIMAAQMLRQLRVQVEIIIRIAYTRRAD